MREDARKYTVFRSAPHRLGCNKIRDFCLVLWWRLELLVWDESILKLWRQDGRRLWQARFAIFDRLAAYLSLSRGMLEDIDSSSEEVRSNFLRLVRTRIILFCCRCRRLRLQALVVEIKMEPKSRYVWTVAKATSLSLGTDRNFLIRERWLIRQAVFRLSGSKVSSKGLQKCVSRVKYCVKSFLNFYILSFF